MMLYYSFFKCNISEWDQSLHTHSCRLCDSTPPSQREVSIASYLLYSGNCILDQPEYYLYVANDFIISVHGDCTTHLYNFMMQCQKTWLSLLQEELAIHWSAFRHSYSQREMIASTCKLLYTANYSLCSWPPSVTPIIIAFKVRTNFSQVTISIALYLGLKMNSCPME